MTAVGNDHKGYYLKKEITRYLEAHSIAYTDFGCGSAEPADYPIYTKMVCEAILAGTCSRGILICGTGNGVSIAANRYRGIRATICHDVVTAGAARGHNDANVLIMGAQAVDAKLSIDIIQTFFNTEFSYAERHIRRLAMIDGLPPA